MGQLGFIIQLRQKIEGRDEWLSDCRRRGSMSLIKLAAFRLKLNPKHRGALRKALQLPQGQTIPLELLQQKLNETNDPTLKKQLQFAINARKWKHGKHS